MQNNFLYKVLNHKTTLKVFPYHFQLYPHDIIHYQRFRTCSKWKSSCRQLSAICEIYWLVSFRFFSFFASFFCASLHMPFVVLFYCICFFLLFFFVALLCRGHCPFSILLASCGTFLASASALGVLFTREMLSNFSKTCNVFGYVACVLCCLFFLVLVLFLCLSLGHFSVRKLQTFLGYIVCVCV